MKKNITLIILTSLILTACSGGNPPPEFHAAQVQVAIPDGQPSGADMTVDQVVKSYADEGSAKWSKLSDTEWMITIDFLDKVTQKSDKMQFVFDKQDNGSVLLRRIVMNGEDASQSDILTFVARIKLSQQQQ
jgi:uncharacterized protein YcfL